MTLHMQTRASRWASLTDVDLRAIHAEGFKLFVSYSAATRLTWSCRVAQHTQPIADGAYIVFWDDDDVDADGNAFSAVNPIFAGYVETPAPGDTSRRVDYTAYDPTVRASREVTVFNAPWEQGTIPDTPPTPDPTGVPRLIYNVRIEADPDWSHQVGGDGTLGQVVGGILDWHYQPLYWLDAAPGDGTDEGNETAYVQDDLDALDHKPQEKMDFQSESVRSAVTRLQRYDPRFKLLWDPATKKWRVRKITESPTVTLTLNDPDVDHPVLSMRIMPSTEQAITAVSFYGPPSPYTDEMRWDDPIDPYASGGTYADPMTELTPVGDPYIYESYSTAGGMFLARFWSAFQITDATKRRGARTLPQVYEYFRTTLIPGQTFTPVTLLSWDHGATWVEWYAARFNFLTGTVYFIGPPPFWYIVDEANGPTVDGSTQKYFPPNAVKLVWAPYGAPLKVRVPETGYEGTAYSVAGRASESFRYDEALAVGKEYGTPVTTTARRAQFVKYGQSILDQSKNIVWTGGAELLFLDWSFIRLNRRVNFAARNGSGGTTTTGWESIDAIVTDVEYDFAARRTRLTFSSDALALFGIDPEQLKTELQIKALQQVENNETTLQFSTFVNYTGYQVQQVTGVTTMTTFSYIDPETGVPQ